MKISITLLLFLLLPILYLQAQDSNPAYANAMKSGLAQLQQAKTAEELTATMNTFSRISDAMPNEWLPAYYKNLARLNSLGHAAPGKEKDKQLEEVLASLDQLLKQQPNNSELLTLKGYQHLLYMSSDPASRGQQWSAKTIQVLQQAIDANPKNPRALLLMGQMQYGMAQFMKSSTEGACRLFSKASALYAEADTEAEPFSPSWGAETAQQMQQRCEPKAAK